MIYRSHRAVPMYLMRPRARAPQRVREPWLLCRGFFYEATRPAGWCAGGISCARRDRLGWITMLSIVCRSSISINAPRFGEAVERQGAAGMRARPIADFGPPSLGHGASYLTRRSPSLTGKCSLAYPRPEDDFLGATDPCAGRSRWRSSVRQV
jgi:hypothetical protein